MNVAGQSGEQAFEVFVIGGGPAGATAAFLLARAGWSVGVAESKEFPRRKVCGEYLSATNWPLLGRLGVADEFRDLAGPQVTRTAIFAGNSAVSAALPRLRGSPAWGRALSREKLDELLLKNASRAGAAVFQPYRCTAVRPATSGFDVRLASHSAGDVQVRTSAVIIAHGSWDRTELSTQQHPSRHSLDDWLGFKAHFRGAALADGLMPLISFPDGYGGMVHCDDDRISLSCCIQRRRLNRLHRADGQSAGEAVFAHIQSSTPIVQPIFAEAATAGPWLSVGPIRPGVRRCFQEGMFFVGNAAGEAHPVVAEGISMAMQSAWMLVDELLPRRTQIARSDVRELIGRAYTAAWRRMFVPRIRFASVIAQWAMRPKLVAAALPMLRHWPGVLTWGAGLSGKDRLVTSGS